MAANEYLNAFAKARSGGKTRVVAINWGIWNEVGMAAEAVAARNDETANAPKAEAGVPLLDHSSFDAAGNRVFTARYTTQDWIIDEHRTAQGDALLPGTGYLSLAAHALMAQGETGAFELRDLTFLHPLTVPTDGRATSVYG